MISTFIYKKEEDSVKIIIIFKVANILKHSLDLLKIINLIFRMLESISLLKYFKIHQIIGLALNLKTKGKQCSLMN